jgi:transcription elongation factor Elf1
MPPSRAVVCPLCPWDPAPPGAALPSARALLEHVAKKHDRPADDASDADLRALLQTCPHSTTARAGPAAVGPRVLYCQRCDAELASVPALRAHARAHARVPCDRTATAAAAAAAAPTSRAAATGAPVVRAAIAQAEFVAVAAGSAVAPTAAQAAGGVEASRFHCPARQCAKSFSRKDTLVKHYAAKHRPRPRRFRCPICEEQFTSKYDLARHHVRVHSGRPKKFTCESCGAGFNQKSQMTMHKQRVHKDKLQKRLKIQHSPRRTLPPSLSVALRALVSSHASPASSSATTTPREDDGACSPATMDVPACADLPICHQRRRAVAVSSPLTPSGD